MNRDQLIQSLRQDWRAIPDTFIRHLTTLSYVVFMLVYLHVVDIHTIETCSFWSNLFNFVISGPI